VEFSFYFAEVVVLHKAWPRECVCGVALLDAELFVLCHGRCDHQVDVHCTAPPAYTLTRRLSVPTLGRYDAHDMASCSTSRCLYISDTAGSCIHRLSVLGNTATYRSDLTDRSQPPN